MRPYDRINVFPSYFEQWSVTTINYIRERFTCQVFAENQRAEYIRQGYC